MQIKTVICGHAISNCEVTYRIIRMCDEDIFDLGSMRQQQINEAFVMVTMMRPHFLTIPEPPL